MILAAASMVNVGLPHYLVLAAIVFVCGLVTMQIGRASCWGTVYI